MTRDDDITEALRPTFAREAAALAERIEQASASGRRDDVRLLAHRLVGTAGTVREDALVDASRELEEVAGDAFSDDYAVERRAREVVGAVRAAVEGVAPAAPAEADGADERAVALPVVVAIEDNAANVALLHRIFERINGVELVTAQSGREGARIAVERSASLVLLDMGLPDVPGEWVLEALQGPDGKVATTVVVVSAETQPDHRQLSRFGVAAYVSKPFDVARLRSLVEEACTAGSRTLVTP